MTVGATTTDTPKVWIGCLAAYNSGSLHGQWVDATDLDTLEEARNAVLKSSPVPSAEEFALMDFEGFGDLIGEYTQLETVAEIGTAIEDHGRGFLAYCSSIVGSIDGEDVSETVEAFEEAFCGEYDSLAEYAEQYADECMEVPERLWPYLDITAVENDLQCSGYRYVDGYVFQPV